MKNPFTETKVSEIVYHGTPEGNIVEFDLAKVTNADFKGFYFSPDEEYTKSFSTAEFKKGTKLAGANIKNEGRTIGAYIDIRNPIDFTKNTTIYAKEVKAISKNVIKEGADKKLFNELMVEEWKTSVVENPVNFLIEVLIDQENKKLQFKLNKYMMQIPLKENASLVEIAARKKKINKYLLKITDGEVSFAEDVYSDQLERYLKKKAHFIMTEEFKKQGFDSIIRPDIIRFEDKAGGFNPFAGKRYAKDNISYIVFDSKQIKIVSSIELKNNTHKYELGVYAYYQKHASEHRAHVADFAHTYEPGVYDIIKNTQAEVILNNKEATP